MSPTSPRLRTLVLGSGAGGGVPQWNCGCRVCQLAWSGDQRVKPRTQVGVALTVDGANWVLLNASIDLRQQILQNTKDQAMDLDYDSSKYKPRDIQYVGAKHTENQKTSN